VGNNEQLCVQWTPSSTYSLDYSSSSLCATVNDISSQPTTTTLSPSANPIFLSNAVTLTATVTPTSGTITPTGTVTYLDGTTVIGTGTLNSSGVTTFTTSSLAAGSHSITASYSGDSNDLASVSNPLTEVVEDFSVAVSTGASVTIEPGTTATYTVTVSPVSPATTFPAAIAMTASGLPTGATYTMTPATIGAGLGTTPVTLAIQVPFAITEIKRKSGDGVVRGLAPFTLALLLLPFAGKLRRAGKRLGRMMSLLLLLAAGVSALAGLTGCGAGIGFFGQAQKTYTVTVTGTSGTLSHSTSVTLTVE
jgi:hypothetical protein